MTTALNTQIQNFDTQIEQLYQQVKALKVAKKETVAKRQKAIAVLENLKASVASALELSVDLGQEFAKDAISIVRDLIPEKKEVAKAVSEQLEETSDPRQSLFVGNQYAERYPLGQDRAASQIYAWQPTENKNVGSNFDLKKGQIDSIHLGASSKAIAKKITSKLQDWFAELSVETGSGDLLDSKFELSISSKSFRQDGLSDRLLRWLSSQDFSNIDTWERPVHLISRATDPKNALSSSINSEKLVAGAKVFSPENCAEYILVSWGNMRAEVKNIWTGKISKKYLTQLEFVL